MSEAIWGDDTKTPGIDSRMSASLENVPRGDTEFAEVTSLESAARAWVALDARHRSKALLTPERAILIDGVSHDSFHSEGIAVLAARLPPTSEQD